METDRNIANVSRKTGISGQNMQHFVSNSTWSATEMIQAVEKEIQQHQAFQEAILVLDESAEEKAGNRSAGAARQHNGRLGKIEMSQVGVFLALVTPQAWTWIDGELYLPQVWFKDSHAELREKTGVPKERVFATKPELGWDLIQRTQARKIPFQAVVMDDLYGRNETLRQKLNNAGIEYYGDVPANTIVYLEEPNFVYPLTKRGVPSKNPKISGTAHEVREFIQQDQLEWQMVRLRASERGYLQAKFSRVRVWVKYDEGFRQEWLLIRQDPVQVTYALSNASEIIPLETMAWRKTHRYLIERSNEDAKDEFGWDEFQTRKYLAWYHQLAFTILAAWFVAETRLDWQQRFAQSPELLAQYEVDVLPKLSVANVRTLLRSAMPLPTLSTDEAAELVIDNLVNRTRSRKSRLRHHKHKTNV